MEQSKLSFDETRRTEFTKLLRKHELIDETMHVTPISISRYTNRKDEEHMSIIFKVDTDD